jgi:hypothetical protein
LTPRSRIGAPFTSSRPSATPTVRNPARTVTVSAGVATSTSYRCGVSADHGSTPGIVISSPTRPSIPSAGARTVAAAGASTRSVPAPVRWS